ncbi:phage portal protein [Methanosphaera cuniculi]|uniref:Phage portal protein n=1 Tax=Methanosphaera cuniculi TaxID=1077256 RepID=A0A2A2HE61_9EURY|nr:phage portal protein [Methanosphaera cuniculi]PAV07645.1 hypothetical protein ASJ82_08185 [Methanosphaera cuniculi]PWL08030.1 phage portal protein [Methanosphaera cuniculi]
MNDDKELLSSSYLVTVDNYDTYSNPQLIDRNTYSQYAFKNGSFSRSAQIDMDKWEGYKVPEYPLQFLSGLLRLNVFHEQCCDIISNAVVGHGWDIVPVSDIDYDPNVENKNKIIDLITHFSKDLREELQEVIYDYEALGCAGIELIRDTEDSDHHIIDIKRLDITYCMLHNDEVRIKQEYNGEHAFFVLYGKNYDENGIKYDVNRYTGEIVEQGSLSFDETAHEVIWVTKYKTNSANYGSAKITTELDTIKSEIGRANFNNKFFENYGLPAFAVSISGDFQDYDVPEYFDDGTKNPDYDITKTLRYKVASQIKEVIKNPHSAVVLSVPTLDETPANIQFTPLSNDVKEASFRLLRQDNKEEICASHGISSDLIGTTKTGNLGGNTALADYEGFVERVIAPLQTLFENRFNKIIIQQDWGIFDWIFKFNQIRKTDISEQITQIKDLLDYGLITRRQAIEKIGKQFGASADPNNPLLDEYTIKGVPERVVFEESIEDFDDSFFENVQQQLLDEAERIEREGNDTTTVSDNELQNISGKKAQSRIQQIFKNEFKARKKIRK